MPNLNPQQFPNHVPYEYTGEHLDEQATTREWERLDKLPVRGNRNRPALVKAYKKAKKYSGQMDRAKDSNKYYEAMSKADKADTTIQMLDKKNRG